MTELSSGKRGVRLYGRSLLPALIGALMLGVASLVAGHPTSADPAVAAGCNRYVAAGDHLPAGHEVSEDERYPEQLAKDHLFNSPELPGWCLYNIAENETTSKTYITDGQLSLTWNRFPDLITLTVGEENPTIINLVNSCFEQVKAHEFASANACAAQILGNTLLWDGLRSDLTTTLQYYRIMMAGRPHLVVAITGYPNPYPKALEASAKIATLCTPLIDTIPTCTSRWVQLPPALTVIDQVFQKLNQTIQETMEPFVAGPNGYRFVYVDTYTKTRDHCMEMKVTIQTQVFHPPNQVHNHDSQEVNFGCDDSWYVAGDDGNIPPSYLLPASTGILINWRQTTAGMGVHPNKDGHKCIADLIWEADTAHPGTTPLKWLLGVGEPADSNICQ